MQPEDYSSALAAGWLPIRDVARQTGVNPVTLRAWERRYGLLQPQRTGKGHRLYPPGQVERIRQILTWLGRGVSVGQVSELLQRQEHQPLAHNLWQEQRQQLLQAIAEQAERRLDDLFNQALTLYPPATLCAQLLLPLLDSLQQRWQGQFGAELERVFFHSWLRSKLGARLYHQNRQLGGAPLLLVNLSQRPLEPGLWLTAWLCVSAACPSEVFDWPLPANELLLAIEHMQPRALLLYASDSLPSPLLQQQLPRLLASSPVPLLLAGPASQIHAASLQDLPGLHLAAGPLAALHSLQHLELLGSAQGSPT